MQIIETSQSILREKHFDILTSINNLTITMKKQERKKDIIKIIIKYVKLRERILSYGHPYILSSAAALAG
jgi:hypothetical protein